MTVLDRAELRKVPRIERLSSEIQELYWSVPLLWSGSTVFVLGGGPSIKSLNLDLIKGVWPVISCNLAFLDYPWVDVTYFGDCKVHTWVGKGGKYYKEFLKYQGLKISCCPDTRDDPDIKTLFRLPKGLTTDRRSIGWNVNTGGSAINLAYHLGARRIILLGFDMKKVEGKDNFHEYNYIKNKHDVYHKFLHFFKFIKRDADKLGLEIINASIDSSLDLFPKVSYEEIIFNLTEERNNEIKSGVSGEA